MRKLSEDPVTIGLDDASIVLIATVTSILQI